MKAAVDKVVVIDYELTSDAGGIIDSSSEAGPLAYLHGADNIVLGLEEAITGKQVGDTIQVSVPPEKAYGERHEEMKQEVPKSLFSGVDKVEAGMQFQSETDQGPVLVTVVSVEEEHVVVDGNHPLAGEQLNFDVIIRDIRDATETEIKQGHPQETVYDEQ